MADLFDSHAHLISPDLGQSAAPYAEKIRMARAATADLSPQERDDFLFGTANRLYFARPLEAPNLGDSR